MSLEGQIKNFYNNKNPLLFTTPSHSQGDFIPESSKKLLGEKVFKCDFSEIEGFDNLRAPEGILKELLCEFSEIYSSKSTFMLTNGSTSGILAAMLSVLKNGDKVIIARNCHVSVTNGLVLTGAVPVWIMPEYDAEWGIFKGITAKNVQSAIKGHPEAKAVILTSPTYEGVFSEVEKISKLTQDAGIPLIVDEAHGSLLPFGEFGSKPAILCGADISIQSLHKTAGALTPAALLHVGKNSLISPDSVQDSLNLINTTSPSYPLMLSMENTVKFLASNAGREAVFALQSEISRLCNEIFANFDVFSGGNDSTKILIRPKRFNAWKLAEYLNKNCKIEEEFTNGKSLLFITGIGTDFTKLRRLFSVLRDIDADLGSPEPDSVCLYEIPEYAMSPRAAFFAEKTECRAENASGKIAAESLQLYPPGIPFVVPGEKIPVSPANIKDIVKIVL